jgi:hypothetical protein
MRNLLFAILPRDSAIIAVEIGGAYSLAADSASDDVECISLDWLQSSNDNGGQLASKQVADRPVIGWRFRGTIPGGRQLDYLEGR